MRISTLARKRQVTLQFTRQPQQPLGSFLPLDVFQKLRQSLAGGRALERILGRTDGETPDHTQLRVDTFQGIWRI